MNKLIAFLTATLPLLTADKIFAQALVENNENANILHQNGQIYLVVLVLVTIFAGIIFYLIRLEKKINKLENQTKK